MKDFLLEIDVFIDQGDNKRHAYAIIYLLYRSEHTVPYRKDRTIAAALNTARKDEMRTREADHAGEAEVDYQLAKKQNQT